MASLLRLRGVGRPGALIPLTAAGILYLTIFVFSERTAGVQRARLSAQLQTAIAIAAAGRPEGVYPEVEVRGAWAADTYLVVSLAERRRDTLIGVGLALLPLAAWFLLRRASEKERDGQSPSG